MLDFDDAGLVYFEDHEGNPLRLRKNTWEKVIGREERENLKYNIEKIRGSIFEPYQVQQSIQDPNVRIIYGEMGNYFILPDVTVTREGWYIAVVAKDDLILTIYPTNRIKEGKVLWPPRKK